MSSRVAGMLASSFALALAAVTIHAAASPAPPPAISAARVRADVEFLADDLLEGREAGTRGHEIAARFAASVLEGAGWAPAGDDGSWFQPVPLVESTPTRSSIRLTLAGTTAEIPQPDEAIVMPSAWHDEVHVSAPVVFAGFGVSAPEFGYDDYAGLDVSGKIVAVLANAPPRFASEPRAHYASAELKQHNAAERGAVALVTLLGPDDAKRFPWARMTSYYGRPMMAWTDEGGTPGAVDKRLRATAYLNAEGAARLFQGGAFSFEHAVEGARKSEPGHAALAGTLTIAVSTSQRRLTSPNVVALLKGSDPSLNETTVVLTAHLDHIGVKDSGEGDRINNGAYDNATGSAILLEVARALAAQPARPKRSILVALVTAEEKGLLGSDYFARHPVRAAGRIVADVNLDMPVFLAAASDIVAFGSESSTLDDVVRKAAGAAGLTLSPDPMPEENIFVRSDQYSLVKRGVPSLYLMPGWTAKDPQVNGSEMFGKFLASNYHQPGDDLTLPMDLGAVAQFTRVNLDIVRAIADDPVAPAWKPGNFFGRTFGGTK
jgi:Zn-dependent M28 family amino/carboxypeptidase